MAQRIENDTRPDWAKGVLAEGYRLAYLRLVRLRAEHPDKSDAELLMMLAASLVHEQFVNSR